MRTGAHTKTGEVSEIGEIGEIGQVSESRQASESGEVAGTLEARDLPDAINQPAPAAQASGPSRLKAMLPMLIGNVALPYLIYVVLGNNGFSTMTALTVSAVPPVVMTVFTALRKQRLDMLGVISLATIVVAIITAMLSGNARFMLAKDGLTPLVLGLAMLGSLLIGKPLIFHVIRTVFGADNPAVLDRLNTAWAHAGYRSAVRNYTALAGVVLLILVVVQVTCAFTLPIGFALPMLNIFQLVVSAALVMGIRHALRKSMRRYAEQAA